MPAGLDGNLDPFVTPERTAVLEEVADMLRDRRADDRPLLVGIDGIDGSGKSTFADELAAHVRSSGVDVVRSTIDSFHNPRTVRWKRGKSSPVGFFLDSHDLDAVTELLLKPFAAGTGSYVTAVFDEPTEQPVEQTPIAVRPSDVLIFDGIFLQRTELSHFWDLVVFLDGQQRVNLGRLAYVMADLPDEPTKIVEHVLEWDRRIDRYSSGMQYYVDLVDPTATADVVIDNNNLMQPAIMRRP